MQKQKKSVHKDPMQSIGTKGAQHDKVGSDLIVARNMYEILEDVRSRPEVAATKRKSTGPVSAPSFIFCYLCGHQFGKASLAFHQPQCYVKKLIEWEKGDVNIRGPKPVDPETHEKEIQARLAQQKELEACLSESDKIKNKKKGTAGNKKSEMELAFFNSTGLVPCSNCGRTFLPDRLQVHLRSCRPGAASASKPLPKRSSAVKTDDENPITTLSAQNNSSSNNTDNNNNNNNNKTPRLSKREEPIRASGSYKLPSTMDEDTVPPGATANSTKVGRASEGAGEGEKETNSPIEKVSNVDASREKSSEGNKNKTPSGANNSGNRQNSTSVARSAEETDAKEIDQSQNIATAGAVVETYASLQGVEVQRNSLGGTSNANHVLENRTSPHDEKEDTADETKPDGKTPEKMIKLNNVSHFKNVKPRIKLDRGNRAPQKAEDTVEIQEGKRVQEKQETPRINIKEKSVTSNCDSPPVAGINVTEAQTNKTPRERTTTPRVLRSQSQSQRHPPLSAERDDADDEENTEEGHTQERTIKFNNVSRFKNVQSRIELELKKKNEDLANCRYCGRHFNPLRLEKHESVCLDRNKPPPPAAAPRKEVSPTSAAVAAEKDANAIKEPKEVTRPRRGSTKAGGALKYCYECGAVLRIGNQRFCGACGAKLA